VYLKKVIIDLIRAVDRVMSEGRRRAVRTDPYARLLLVHQLLTLPFLTMVPVPRSCSPLTIWIQENLNIVNAFVLVAFGL
jgi:hypothetical protein